VNEQGDDQLAEGMWASLSVQCISEGDGKAVVRLPNGSKATVSRAALHPMIVQYSVNLDVPPEEIAPGDIYEDCNYHPVLCVARDGDEIRGISLIDGSQPRACSLGHCGVVKLEIADVIKSDESGEGN